ncbi:hypothetical protein LCGC14_0548620 [marine sediment metagenome]|uniref:Uncharacterized protein n=1 Tax=marine sediment metagenome TaxID=412755 RepID=A0A0F9S956_9ZZZZ
MFWTLKNNDKKWLEEENLRVHSGYDTIKEAEKEMRQIWDECNPYISKFMVIVSKEGVTQDIPEGKYWYEQRHCILVNDPDIEMETTMNHYEGL